MKVRTIINRIYADYLLPNRLNEYRRLLEYALKEGYTYYSTIGYYDYVKSDFNKNESKIIILRHDIDSDTKRARDFFNIEKELGIKSTFYFRLSTLSHKLMCEIEDYGSEASYHFEEVAAFSKRNCIRDRQTVIKAFPQIREEFIKNYFNIKNKNNLPMRSVASHGDFVNRHLNIINNELLTPDVREICGIEVEAYDPIIKKDCVSISDTGYPEFWRYNTLDAVIKRKEPCINFLSHPRHWGAAPWTNTKDNIIRLLEGISYRL